MTTHHYGPLDGITGGPSLYDAHHTPAPAVGPSGSVLPPQPSVAHLPRSPTSYSPHPGSAASAGGPMHSPVGYPGPPGMTAGPSPYGPSAGSLMNSSTAAVAAVDGLLKRDKDAIYG
jgi:hypothetical protein